MYEGQGTITQYSHELMHVPKSHIQPCFMSNTRAVSLIKHTLCGLLPVCHIQT